MKKVEQIGDKYYIDGQEVEIVKAEPPKEDSPGTVWAEQCTGGRMINEGECPVHWLDENARHDMRNSRCVNIQCPDCEQFWPLFAAAYDAGLAAQTMMTVEEYEKHRGWRVGQSERYSLDAYIAANAQRKG